jgi:hypothetical protein
LFGGEAEAVARRLGLPEDATEEELRVATMLGWADFSHGGLGGRPGAAAMQRARAAVARGGGAPLRGVAATAVMAEYYAECAATRAREDERCTARLVG